MPNWLRTFHDTRDKKRITYPARFLVWVGFMIFLLKLGSRRKIGFELDSPRALVNLNCLSQCSMESVAHHDTLNHFLGHVPPSEFNKLRRNMVFRLVRMKALEQARLRGCFLIVLDGTGQFTFPKRHCEHCMERTYNGKKLYFHYVLEAKLVTPNGLAISVESEFIENADPNDSKQDCELKAFARLASRFKKNFPQLRLCLCMDALYANGPVMDICRKYRWGFIITFKEGSLPAVWREYQTLLKLSPKNRKMHLPHPGCQQTFAWVEEMEYVDDRKKIQKFSAFQCRENDHGEERFFAWITNFSVRADTVATLANQGGRCRWKIENQGFNTQKNGGFNLEHAYSTHDRQIKNFYLLMQIAHLILQLIEKGNLLGKHCQKLFGSLRNLARRLSESIRHCVIHPDALDAAAAAHIQIRLDTS